jgi:hypothetical protein
MKTKEFYEGLLTACILAFEDDVANFVIEKDFKFWVEIFENSVKVNWSHITHVNDPDMETGDCEVLTRSGWEIFGGDKISKIYFSFWEICNEACMWEVKSVKEAIEEYQQYIDENTTIEPEI